MAVVPIRIGKTQRNAQDRTVSCSPRLLGTQLGWIKLEKQCELDRQRFSSRCERLQLGKRQLVVGGKQEVAFENVETKLQVLAMGSVRFANAKRLHLQLRFVPRQEGNIQEQREQEAEGVSERAGVTIDTCGTTVPTRYDSQREYMHI